VHHEGNTNSSDEQVNAVAGIVDRLFANGASFVDAAGNTAKLRSGAGPKDVLVVAPYNAQVAALKERSSDRVEVGTVDKFQGKEAPIVIYSMTTSSGEDAPRGLEFYSLNHLNVATSRQGLGDFGGESAADERHVPHTATAALGERGL
jgi:hypothetical protein